MNEPKVILLDAARIEFWRKKFFGWMMPDYGTKCVVEILLAHQKKEGA